MAYLWGLKKIFEEKILAFFSKIPFYLWNDFIYQSIYQLIYSDKYTYIYIYIYIYIKCLCVCVDKQTEISWYDRLKQIYLGYAEVSSISY